MDLLLAAPGQTVFWQPQKRIAVCSPPKVGTSFSHSWLVWSEVRPETACKYGVQQLDPRRATPARAAQRRELSAQKVTQEFFDFGVAFHAVA